jgi:thiol-disulfide isomerase/thioredoxin
MDYTTDYFEMNNLFLSLDGVLKTTARGKELDSILAVLKRGSNGQKMIDFKQNQPDGSLVSFSSFKGKYVLVDFWASWCGPCRAENPRVLKAYNKYKDKGFTVLGISIDSKKDKWEKAISEDQMPWIQVSDLKGSKNEIAVYYGIHAIPSNYLVDQNGVIIGRNLRGKDLEDKLEVLLGTKSK